MNETMNVAGEHAADRLMRQQKITSDLYLRGEPPPTPQQVSAVLHALADHTLLMHMNSPEVLATGWDRAHLGDDWQAATAQGRFFQRMGDWLDCFPTPTPRPVAAEQTTPGTGGA